MTTLTNQSPGSTYLDLLQISNSNIGLDTILRPIEGGNGTEGSFLVSTTGLQLKATTTFNALSGAIFTGTNMSFQGNYVYSGGGTIDFGTSVIDFGTGTANLGDVSSLILPNAISVDTISEKTGSAGVTFGSAVSMGGLATTNVGPVTTSTGPQRLAGTNTPEAAVTAVVGSTFHRDNGGASTSFYVKESGTGNTGWVAVGGGVSSWTTLTDTPGAISAGLAVQGNAGGTALEFGQALATTSSPTFSQVTLGNTGLTVGSSSPFSDSSGTLTLRNIDALDATTESTIEAAIDSLANLAVIQSQGISFSGPLTVESASTINQDVTTDASPTFGGMTAGNITVADITMTGDELNRSTDSDGIRMSGGTGPTVGANLTLFGSSQGSSSSDIRFRTSSTVALLHDSSASEWDFQDNAITTTGNISTTGNLSTTGKLNVGAAVNVTITSGAITATSSFHELIGFGGGPDTLDTINGGSPGDILVLKGFDFTSITLDDNAGNLRIGGDFVISNPDTTFTLIRDTANWLAVAEHSN